MSYTEIGEFFRYPKHTFNIRELQLTYEGPIKHHLLAFESPLVTPYAENNTSYFHWYEPMKRSNLALLVIHGWRGSDRSWHETKIAWHGAKLGFNTVVPCLPYHGRRTPKGAMPGIYFFGSPDEKRSINAFRQSIMEFMVIADWGESMGWQWGVIGTSLGGILLNTLMGVDPRYKWGVSIVGGAHIHRIVWEGVLGLAVRYYLKKRGLTKKDYLYILDDYAKFLDELDHTGKLPQTRWLWYYLDPLTYARYNSPRKVVLINGLFDPIIPSRVIKEFSQRAHPSAVIWLPAGHFGVIMAAPITIYWMLKFLKYKLSE